MKKYLLPIAIIVFVILAAFFVYKKMYGSYIQPAEEQSANILPVAAKGSAFFGE